MKKIIIKTIIITLCSVFALSFLTFGAFSIFAPDKVAQVYAELGNEKMAFKYNEKAFKKEQSSENLQKVLLGAITLQDDEKVIEYFNLYLENKNLTLVSEEEHVIAGNYCVALAKKGEKSKAITVALGYFSPYTKINPMRYLIAFALENDNGQLAEEILTALKEKKSTDGELLSENGKELLNKDIESLTEYVNL